MDMGVACIKKGGTESRNNYRDTMGLTSNKYGGYSERRGDIFSQFNYQQMLIFNHHNMNNTNVIELTIH